MNNPTQLSQAIVAYLQKGSAASPRSDRTAVRALVGEAEAEAAIAEVERVVKETISVPVDWRGLALGDAGRAAGAEMRRRYPWLSAQAIDALQWAFTFAWR
ncbi:hypothetical protein ACWKWP_01675 [Agromyces soli]